MFGFSSVIGLREEDVGYTCAQKEIIQADQAKSLNLDRFSLEYLPREIQTLSGKHALQRLDLSHNCFTSLSPEIGLLTQLKELKLCSNLRTPFSLSPAIGNLTNLVNLKLSGNSLTEIPEEIGKLTNLFMIDLSHNNLTKLPRSFDKLTNLLEIRLENNKLTKLPTLSSKLKFLSISFNTNISLHKLFQNIEKLSDIHHLEMRACEITEWPSAFSSLGKLTYLDLGCNRIASLPDRCLLQLPLLQHLFLDHNQLTEIPDDIGKLTSLVRLILSGNDFQEVPLSFRHLTSLQEFTIDEENMLIPPREVVRNGLSSIRFFIESLAEESLPCFRIRLVVLGNSLSGKSSLLRRLRSGKSLKKKDAHQSDTKGTQFIDKRVIKLSSKQADGTNATVEFNAWDFCFDTETSHQFFLAPKSLFLVTVDLREVAKVKLRYWLQSIATRAGSDAPIFLVGTHADDKMFKEEGSLSNVLNMIAQEFGSCFPGIKLITAVSSYDGSGIDELRNSLITTALNQKHVGRIIPKPYTLLEDAVKTIREEKISSQVPPLLSWRDYMAIAAKCHIHTESTLRSATSFLRDLGIVITFPDEEQASHLTPVIALDPHWICEMTHCLMTSSDCKNGLLKDSQRDHVWKAPMFPSDVHHQCIQLLRAFGITAPGLHGQEIIPKLFQAQKPDLQLIWLRTDSSRIQYARTWQFDYIPANLFNLLAARLMVISQIHSLWKHGCVTSLFGDWALLEEFTATGHISLTVRSSTPSAPLIDFLTNLMAQLLSNQYPKIEYKLKMLCTHCVQQLAPDTHSFPVDEIEQALLASQTYLMCTHKGINTKVDIKMIAPDLALAQSESIKIDITDIEMEKTMLAEGAYGVLYRGIYQDQPVAVKLLRTEGASQEEQIEIFQEFRKEVTLMSAMVNENIVELKGYCYGKGDIGMVMELVDSGDLHGLITDKSKTLSPSIYLKIAFDIAQGLLFMHSLSPPILHRDLKPGNVLLSHSNNKWKYTAKLADFGLSTRQYLRFLTERAVETPIWLSPEILSGGHYSTPSDVFAFGIILYEMVERKLPYENFDFRFLNQLEEEIISGKRCDISHIEEIHPGVANLISTCWHHDPNKRPDFLGVLKRILNISVDYDRELKAYLSQRLEKIMIIASEKAPEAKEEPTQHAALTGRFLKKIQTDPPETVSCMIVVGNDIWVAHTNGDISIWNSENGKLFRQIIAAHSREIQTMVLVGKLVWTGARDGMIRIWKTRAFPDVEAAEATSTSQKVLKEGYLEPADGSPATFISLHNMSKDLIEGAPLTRSRTVPINEQTKCGFILHLANGSFLKFYCANAKDRDEWVSGITYASRNLSEETQDLTVAQIAQKRRVQIHSLVYTCGKVYACVSDLFVRSYNPTTFEFIEEYSLISNSNWKNATASRRERHGAHKGSFLSTENLTPQARKPIKSVNFGKQRGKFNTMTAPELPRVNSVDKLDAKEQVVSVMYAYGGYIWAVIHYFVLRYSADSMKPMGQLAGHSLVIRDICGVDNTLWSCSEDRTISVWDIHKLQRLMVIHTDVVGYSLLKVGPSVWCGAEKDIVVWDIKDYKKIRELANKHADPITSLIIVWNRIVWSASLDQTICIWS